MNILNKLTLKHLKLNKKRTIVTIIGVILSTSLMVGIGLLFSTVRDNSIKSIIESVGSQHLTAHIITSDIDILDKDKSIKKYNYIYDIGYAEVADLFSYYHLLSQDNFDDFKIIKGELPKNSNEIIVNKRISNWLDEEVNIGDTITIDIGTLTNNGKAVYNTYYDNLKIVNTKKMKLKVVGFYENDYSMGLDIYTTKTKSDNLIAYITFKNVKKAYQNIDNLANKLSFENVCSKGTCYEELEPNDSLLSMYGVSKYNNVSDSLTKIIIIILSLVSIGCIIVIYNSFAISVMERKKQFGLFSSIGATKAQLRKTVYFEALIIGLIGIPLGILGGLFGIWVVINIINNLLSEVFTYPLQLAIYPLFMYIPIIFMIITIFVSALIPSFMASRVNPITAIRQNDDIKIRNKKIKTPKFIRKLFSIEGEIALKNMKRNKKKYRVTIISLFISIVLFVSFSGFANYGIKTMYRYTELPDFDIEVNLRTDSVLTKNTNKFDFNSIIKRIVSNEDVKEYAVLESIYEFSTKIDTSLYDEKYYDEIISKKYTKQEDYDLLLVTVLDNDNYNKLKKSFGLKEDKVIVNNYTNKMEYTDDSRVSKRYKIYKDNNLNFKLYQSNYSADKGIIKYKDINITLDNIYLASELPLSIMGDVVISESMRDNLGITKLIGEPNNKTIHIKANPYKNIEKVLKEINDEDKDYYFNYYNVVKEMNLISNAVLAIKILLYGFIGLVTLIGVTSVFNTINTSIALRRREFSMLRSIGLTPKGFNKILYFESFFFGLKSLLYGIPVSIGVVYLLHKSFRTMVEFGTIMIPWISILESIIGVFIIVLISMLYASSKIKKENILESLREENI